MPAIRRLFTAAVLGLLIAAGGLPAAVAAPDHATITMAAADRVIIPGYAAFRARAGDLEAAARTFCAGPDPAGLAAVRQGFHGAMDAWQGVQLIYFGPAENMHRAQRVHFWPDTKGAGDRQLRQVLKARDAAPLEGPRMVFASAALQGLPVLESLLFDATAADRILAGGEEGAFRCQVVVAVAANLVVIGQELVDEWSGDEGFRAAMTGAGGPGSPFTDHRQAASILYNALHGHLEAIAEVKLGKPLGAAPEAARRQRAESWRAARSLLNITLNLEAVRAVVATAFAPTLPPAVAERLDVALAAALAAAGAVGPDLETAVETPDGWAALAALKARVKDVARLLADEAGPALDLQVGFNALDGD